MGKPIAVLAVATACLLAACSGSSGSSGSSSSKDTSKTTAASGSTSGSGSSSSSDCTKDNSTKGVIRVFCDGPAKATFTIGSTQGTIDGGSCETSGGYFVLNAGTVIDTSFTGTKPDYIGLLMPPDNGDFSGAGKASGAITYGGKGYVLTELSGSHDSTSGTFTGTSLGDSTTISGSFTC